MIVVKPTDHENPQTELRDRYDVVVIGAGPAGCTVAALTAEAGLNVLVLDRSAFPRFHVGESLVPETYWTLERLGLIEKLKQSAFPKKYSVQFVSDGEKYSAPFYFDKHNPHESSQTWQVVRGEFDQMLLDNAVAKGAVARTDARVLDVLLDGDRALGVKAQLGGASNGSVREIAANVVVDATGVSAFLASRLGLKQTDKRLRKGTVWTYFRGARRDEGERDSGATLIMQTPGKQSWFWYIPLSDDEVSVGCTGGMQYMFGSQRGSAADVFNDELSRCPAMAARVQHAEQVTDYFTTKDYSYRASQAAGDGWVLVGDAFGFIDPVYSTGVFLALKSGEMAADGIAEAHRSQDFSAKTLGRWQEEYVAGVELFRKLVYAFYAPDFSFGDFLREHPQYRGNLVDILVGAVFKPGVGDIFDAMGDVLPPLDESM